MSDLFTDDGETYRFNIVFNNEELDFLIGYDGIGGTIAVNISGYQVNLDKHAVHNLIVALSDLSRHLNGGGVPDEFELKYVDVGEFRYLSKDYEPISSLEKQVSQRLARIERRMSKLEDLIDDLDDTLEEVAADLIEIRNTAKDRELRVEPDSPPTVNWGNIAALRGIEDILSHPEHLSKDEIENLQELRNVLRKVKE